MRLRRRIHAVQQSLHWYRRFSDYDFRREFQTSTSAATRRKSVEKVAASNVSIRLDRLSADAEMGMREVWRPDAVVLLIK